MAKLVGWTLFLVLVLAIPIAELAAQRAPWTISIEMEGGAFLPTRSFGSNPRGTEDPNLIALQPSAKANAVAIFGGGIRIQLPNPTMSLRLSGYRTLVGTVISSTRACNVLAASDPLLLPLRQRLQCDNPFEEGYTLSEATARVQFKRLSDDGGRLRPTIDLGVGLRRYSFGGSACLSDATLLEEARFVCDNAAELTVNQTQPFVLFGIGLEYALDKFAIFARVQDQLSPFSTTTALGNRSQNDLLASIGLAVDVR